MNKFLKLAAAAALAMSMAACSSSDDTSTDDTTAADDTTEETSETTTTDTESDGTFTIHVEGDDWGCGVDKVIVHLNKSIDSVDADSFTVSEHKQSTDWTDETFPVIEADFDRTVEDAYLSDAEGEKVDGPSEYVTLELYISPDDGSPFLYTMATGYNTWSDPYEMTITLAEGKTLTSDGEEITDMVVTGSPESKTTEADSFTASQFQSSDGYDIDYALWTPEEKSTTLFVWLHGMGEGGAAQVDNTDWMVPILANEVTAYIGEEFQETLGGANILVPQSPTFWMDTVGDPDADTTTNEADGTSAYTESLHELIAQVKEDTGSEKVVIAGCSNGGYMTMVLAMEYGDEYTAYVPICEAVNDEDITDEQIEELAKLPIYFIWAETDTTVDPSTHEEPTIERLKEAGAAEVVVSTTANVTDTTGRFTDDDGNAYEYNGHWSWIIFDNNESVSTDGISAWQWIADQINK